MPDDRRLTIGSTSRLGADDIARRTFATARRGFDPGEVRVFLQEVARELHAAAMRERELADALADAERRAASPELDETTLTVALGEQTAKVLKSAHDAAAELMSRAEADVSRMRADVEEQMSVLRARVEHERSSYVAEAQVAAEELSRRAQQEADSRLDSATAEATVLLDRARAECKAMVTEAQEKRARVLSDLTRRRRVLATQIDQLRAGRERLAEIVGAARATIDRVTEEMFRAEDEARLAAEEAGRNPTFAEPDDDDPPPNAPSAPTGATGKSPTGAAAPATPDTAVESPAAASTGDGDASPHAVEELFARLRAEQSTPGESVKVIGKAPATPGASKPRTSATPTSGTSRAKASSAVVVEEADSPVATPEAHPEGAAPSAEDPNAALVARRNDLLDPLAGGLARRIKRAMQDDQNDILDRLRATGAWSNEVLPSADEHEQRYVRAALGHLDDAARAGASFAGGREDDAPGVAVVAEELAAAIVGPLRLRLAGERVHELVDESSLVDHVGAAFREWKGQRVERVATDHALSAFSMGILSTTTGERQLHWVVDDAGVQCPDCDDNALAGGVPSGGAFPTGHLHPPAHSGCRCLLAPVTS
ncbi:MAG: DivIVA domain-containing protein [Acidimicrobiales bacterium]